MKKTMSILLLLVLCCALAACGKYNTPPTEPPMNLPTAAPTAAPTEAPTEMPTAAPTEAPTAAPTEPPTEPPTEAPTEAPTEPDTLEYIATVGDKVANLAKEQLEKPYSNGGSGPDSFDVSGLVYYCFRQYDIKVPRTVKELGGHGEEVEKEDLLPGDVVFFYNDEPGTIQYCGIYIGDGYFIAARKTGYPVSEMFMNGNYYTERYICARRFWE